MSQKQNWAAYFYPEPYQHVMRNIPGIKDPAALSLFEHRIITRRGYELTKNPKLIARTFDAEHLKAIHSSRTCTTGRGSTAPWTCPRV